MDINGEANKNSDASLSAARKGKCRAPPETEPTERSPLLGPSGSSGVAAGSFHESILNTESHQRRRRHRLLALLLSVFLGTLGFCVLAGLLLLLVAHTYEERVETALKSGALDRSFVWRGPDRVDVLNATNGRLWIQVDLRAGIDAGSAVDTVVGLDGNWYEFPGLQRALGRWAVRRVGTMTATIDEATLYSSGKCLAGVSLPSITLPLRTQVPVDSSWLTRLSLTFEVHVTQNGTDLAEFARESWANGYASGFVSAKQVSVHGGGEDENSWRLKLEFLQKNIRIPARIKIPDLPGLPSPGRDTPFPELADLVALKSFHISSANHSVSINASAELINPLPESLEMRIPALPFFVALSGPNGTNTTSVTVTLGHTQPFFLTHPNITLSLIGTIPPIPADAGPALSNFASSYLNGQDADIIVGSPILPSLELPAVFPGPDPKPQILRDVHIKDMRISLRGESVLASGIVYAHIVLPAGIDVGLDARDIWPDVLVFDGEVPDDDDDIGFISDKPSQVSVNKEKDNAKVPKEPLPSPLPPRAFARIRPDDWLPAQSARLPPKGKKGGSDEPDSGDTDEEEKGAEYEVSAQVVDVPLEVLPGRDALLRNFIGKVLFGGREGALAGVKGTAAVAAAVDGLPIKDGDGNGQVMELLGLPFSGSVRVGRKSM